MNNHFIKLTHFVSKKPFYINVNKIVTVEPEEGEGNARITTCLNLSYYTVETVMQIMSRIKGANTVSFNLNSERLISVVNGADRSQ